jgi:N-succinyldiaminopimelate aminotransferase
MSKAWAMAGARVGFVHGPPEVMARIRGVHMFQMYSAPRPMQEAAARVLVESDGWLADARQAYEAAGRQLAETLGVAAPEAGTFVFVDCAPHFAPGEDITSFLVRCLEAGVLMAPGAVCGAAYGSWARACFTALPPAELADALAALAPIFRRR